jgi:hypothetical protein
MKGRSGFQIQINKCQLANVVFSRYLYEYIIWQKDSFSAEKKTRESLSSIQEQRKDLAHIHYVDATTQIPVPRCSGNLYCRG